MQQDAPCAAAVPAVREPGHSAGQGAFGEGRVGDPRCLASLAAPLAGVPLMAPQGPRGRDRGWRVLAHGEENTKGSGGRKMA